MQILKSKNGGTTMSDEKKDKKNDDMKLHTSNLDYILCPTHNIRYPKGANCPMCEKEEKKD